MDDVGDLERTGHGEVIPFAGFGEAPEMGEPRFNDADLDDGALVYD